MLLVYTGNGKGKTSACIGQAVRALGQDLRVAFAQCMKSNTQAGEQRLLASLLGELFYVGGLGFFRDEATRPAHREAALATIAWAQERLATLDMVVLDESLYALKAGLITQEELTAFIDEAQVQETHVVLSGRGAPQWLVDKAHLVTEMQEIKHHWQQGIQASRGIEF